MYNKLKVNGFFTLIILAIPGLYILLRKLFPVLQISHNQQMSKLLNQHGYAKVFFNRYESGHIYVDGALNNVAGRFIVDSGAGGTVIEKKMKEKFGVQGQKTEETATGAGGSGLELEMSQNNAIAIGDFTKSEINLLIMDLDHVNNAFAAMGLEKVDGVIGADILKGQDAIIDYKNNVLFLKK